MRCIDNKIWLFKHYLSIYGSNKLSNTVTDAVDKTSSWGLFISASLQNHLRKIKYYPTQSQDNSNYL